jgi:uncharacterized protein (DUF427 family)
MFLPVRRLPHAGRPVTVGPPQGVANGSRELMKAIWNGTVIAESDDTVVVEGNHYFPKDSIDERLFVPSENRSVCHWKGTASYYHVEVDGKRNSNAAWYYPTPSAAASEIAGHVAFWHGVEVVPA